MPNLIKINPDMTRMLETYGQSGTYNFYGIISNEEYNRKLTGKLALEAYDIMRKSDATCRALLQAVKLPMLAADKKVMAADDSPLAKEQADLVQRELFERNINFIEFEREAYTMYDFGHSLFELIYDPDATFNGKPCIGLKDIASRKQRSVLRFTIGDPQEDILGITQLLPKGGQAEIPRDKMAWFINEREGENWLGISLLRYAYKPWKQKDALEIMNAIALERQGVGVPYMKSGVDNATPSPDDIKEAEKSLVQLYANQKSYLKYINGIEIGFMNMAGGSTKEILPTLLYLDRQIMKSGLLQFLELGSGNASGSKAVSSDHSDLYNKSLEAHANNFKETVEREIIQRLVDINYSKVPDAGYPKLLISNMTDQSLADITSAITNLAGGNLITPDPDLENHLRDLTQLPKLPDDIYNDYEKYHQKTSGKVDQNQPESNDAGDAENKANDKDNKGDKPNNQTKATIEYRDRLIAAVAAEV